MKLSRVVFAVISVWGLNVFSESRCLEVTPESSAQRAGTKGVILMSDIGFPTKNRGACAKAVEAADVKADAEEVTQEVAAVEAPAIPTASLSALESIKAPSVYFALNSSKLSLAARKELKGFAKLIADKPVKAVVVSGFADKSGSADTNLMLSKQRAQAVKKEISGLLGVNAEKVRIQALGSSPSGASRRVDIQVQ